jgi:hypothetical protein
MNWRPGECKNVNIGAKSLAFHFNGSSAHFDIQCLVELGESGVDPFTIMRIAGHGSIDLWQ